jgi:thiamine biosynthesis lipoprotein
VLRILSLGIGSAAGLAALACARPEPGLRLEYRALHMGVETRLVLFAPDSAAGLAAAMAAFDRIAELDSLMSDYRLDSELNALNASAGGAGLIVSPDLARVLATALDVAERSGGAFDVTAGPVVALWRESRRTGRLPDAQSLERARSLVDWRRVRVDAGTRHVRLTAPGMRLDLGGIAKGYAAEAARTVLRENGVERGLVEIGGELALGRAPPGTAGWTVELGAGPRRRAVLLENTVVATSGGSEQHIIIGGVAYSHVIEPGTGLGSTRAVTATAIGPAGALADALATACTLLERPGRDRLAAAYPGYTLIVEPDA